MTRVNAQQVLDFTTTVDSCEAEIASAVVFCLLEFTGFHKFCNHSD